MFSTKIVLSVLYATSASARYLVYTPSYSLSTNTTGSLCAFSCATACYKQAAIDDAVQDGYQLHQQGKTEGRNKYPHEFDDREGFKFSVSRPYYEFPILLNGDDFDGSSSPGADRVVFNNDGLLAGVVTHHGADGNNFVQCDQGGSGGSGSGGESKKVKIRR